MTEEKIWIGVNDAKDKIVYAEETRAQIEKLKKYELDIIDEDGKPVKWENLDNPEEKRSLLQYIEGDRRMRKEHIMAGRPPILIATVRDGKVVRIEFYTGHDSLSIEIDARSKDLNDVSMDRTYTGW